MEEPQVEKVLDNAHRALNNNDISLALQYFLQAAEFSPEDIEIINHVARCYYVLGEFDRALACWNLALVTDPTDTEALRSTGEFNDLPFQFWLKRYREAVSELENRNYQKAGDMLSDLITEQDGFVSLYQLLGLCHFAESDIESARRVWSRGLTLDIANPILLKYLAMHREELGEISLEPLSGGSRRRLLKTASWSLVACLGLFLLIQMGLGFYRHSGLAVLPGQARNTQSQQQHSSVAGTVNKATPLRSPGFAEDSNQGDQYETGREAEYYRKGYSAYLERDWPTACSNLGVVVAMNSGSYINREALYYLAQSYYLRKDYKQARDHFEKYLAVYPKSDYIDDSLYYMGCSAIAEKDYTAAREAFTRLGQVDPRSGYFTTKQYQNFINKK
ncbi:MAG: tetratricopeptide repeat protein [Deltaproteobacteria bacterium]